MTSLFLASCCRWAVIFIILILVCCSESKALPLCESNIEFKTEIQKPSASDSNRNGLDTNSGETATSQNTLGVEENFTHTHSLKKKKHSLVNDWLDYINPDSPPRVVEQKANQFKNLMFEDVSDEDTRGMLKLLGFEQKRQHEPEIIIFTPGFNYKKIGLGK